MLRKRFNSWRLMTELLLLGSYSQILESFTVHVMDMVLEGWSMYSRVYSGRIKWSSGPRHVLKWPGIPSRGWLQIVLKGLYSVTPQGIIFPLHPNSVVYCARFGWLATYRDLFFSPCWICHCQSDKLGICLYVCHRWATKILTKENEATRAKSQELR